MDMSFLREKVAYWVLERKRREKPEAADREDVTYQLAPDSQTPLSHWRWEQTCPLYWT